jgi:RNA polymerase sigma factor (sigma-70 family)
VEPEKLADLVRAAASGDGPAWRAVVERYSPLVWSVARSFGLGRFDAEDVVQTTWERFSRAVGDLREPERVGAWLATTARREAIRVQQIRNRTLPTGDLDWMGIDDADDASPEAVVIDRTDAVERAALGGRAWAAMKHLSAGCQQLLRVLMATPAPTYAEAAAALGRSVGYIGPMRRRCLDRLRGLMNEPVSHESQPHS